jgi:hypothetical protein
MTIFSEAWPQNDLLTVPLQRDGVLLIRRLAMLKAGDIHRHR